MKTIEKTPYDYSKIVEPLLEWYDWNARILPWRQDPQPYHVWISEIMLQQTRVEAVKPYYDRFLMALPTIVDLACVPDDKLMKLWEGLGYYNRARNLKIAANTLVQEYGGRMPASYELLLALKGIGSYTAGAIASIAFKIPTPAVDGNVLRVAMRLENCQEDIAKASVKKRLEQELTPIISRERPGDFNQAFIELGATVCIPNGKPLCDNCPLRHLCIGYREDTCQDLPVKAKKKARKMEERTILVYECNDRFAIQKRKEKGLLAGLWELPGIEGRMRILEVERMVREQVGDELDDASLGRITSLGDARHIFSHIEWQMHGYLIRLTKEEAQKCKEYVWATKEELLQEYSIPTAFRAYVQW